MSKQSPELVSALVPSAEMRCGVLQSGAAEMAYCEICGRGLALTAIIGCLRSLNDSLDAGVTVLLMAVPPARLLSRLLSRFDLGASLSKGK